MCEVASVATIKCKDFIKPDTDCVSVVRLYADAAYVTHTVRMREQGFFACRPVLFSDPALWAFSLSTSCLFLPISDIIGVGCKPAAGGVTSGVYQN